MSSGDGGDPERIRVWCDRDVLYQGKMYIVRLEEHLLLVLACSTGSIVIDVRVSERETIEHTIIRGLRCGVFLGGTVGRTISAGHLIV